MAHSFLTQATGSLLEDLLTRASAVSSDKAEKVATWITEATRPPVGARIVTESGDEYTGLAFIRNNSVLLMLALRDECSSDRSDIDRDANEFGSDVATD